MEKEKTALKTNCQDAIELLARIKASKGKRKLNKLGEWMLSGKGKTLGWEVAPENMKYILK